MSDLMYVGNNAVSLYEKYHDELLILCEKLQPLYHQMQHAKFGTTFGDTEGELLYMLLREAKPEVVFEISPNAGWSTNYMLSALTKNQKGTLHSFELMEQINNKSIEQVIRGNQHRDWNQEQLVLHIGDALETTRQVTGNIDFVLIDSCHDDWFAKWYIETIFPHVQGIAFVQDIAFIDGLEDASEAEYFWQWAQEHQLPLNLVGHLDASEQIKQQRLSYAECRVLCSNSVVASLPQQDTSALPSFQRSPADEIQTAHIALESQDRVLALRHTNVANNLLHLAQDNSIRHRYMMQVGKLYQQLDDRPQAQRTFRRALAYALVSDPLQRHKQLKAIFREHIIKRRFGWILQTSIILSMTERGGFMLGIKTLLELIRERFR